MILKIISIGSLKLNNEVLEKLLNDKVGTTLIKDFAKEKISFDLAKSFYEIDKKIITNKLKKGLFG